MGEFDKEMHDCALSRLTWVTEVGLAPEEGWSSRTSKWESNGGRRPGDRAKDNSETSA